MNMRESNYHTTTKDIYVRITCKHIDHIITIMYSNQLQLSNRNCPLPNLKKMYLEKVVTRHYIMVMEVAHTGASYMYRDS